MMLGIHRLEFVLPESPFSVLAARIDALSTELQGMGLKAGTGSDKYKHAYSRLRSAIISHERLEEVIDSPIMVRALGFSLQSELRDKLNLNASVVDKIKSIRPNPSSLLIQSIYQHYLSKYDDLEDQSIVADWLLVSLEKKNLLKSFHKNLLGSDGPKWLAHECIKNNREFANQLSYVDLDNYQAGRFLTVSKGIYFVEQLNSIPVNQSHPLLLEVQTKAAFESRYDEHYLLGHKIIEILIKRAPDSDIHDSWLNVILAIAGDPRVAKSHPNYRKWWSRIDSNLTAKVNGWLSRLDLRLFLEALENYSSLPGNSDLRRMFPARKDFLIGLLEKGLIAGTRLYLTHNFSSYLRRNYNAEHLPNYSTVSTGQISVIHIKLGMTQMIEGSHNCKLWIYKSLDSSAIVFDYGKRDVSYTSLTTGLNWKMKDEQGNQLLIDSIVHHPNLGWQNKAIKALKASGVDIRARDVLSAADYELYKRRYGAG